MYRPSPRLRQAEVVCDRALVDLTRAAKSATSPKVNLGGRVWLLPKWYMFAQHEEWTSVLYLSELLKFRPIRRPRLYCAARFYGDVGGESGICWTVGKGMPGVLTTTSADDAHADLLWLVIDHDKAWPSGLEIMDASQWLELDQGIRLRRRLDDAKRLKRIYGTAIGVGLRDPASGARVGCITLHSPKARPLSELETKEVLHLMLASSTELSRQLCSRLRLEFSVSGT